MRALFYSLFIFICCATLEADIERRGSFDVGSGSLKVLVADVDTETQHITQYLFSEVIRVPFSDDLAKSSDGSFSKEIQAQAKETIATLIQHAEAFKPTSYSGVATEAFRLAKNGQQLIAEIASELNVPISIISQQEEGALGFGTVVELTRCDPDYAIVWDIGGGSFQVSWKEGEQITSYMGNFAKVPMKNIILAVQGKSQKENLSPNPISLLDFTRAKTVLTSQLKPISSALQKRISDPKTQVFGVGGIHNGNICRSLGGSSYTLGMVEKLLSSRLGLGDECFEEIVDPTYWVSDLVFIVSVMSHLGIDKVENSKAYNTSKLDVTGNTIGILVNPKYWGKAGLAAHK